MLRDRPLVYEEFRESLSTTGGSWAAQSNTQATPPTCQSAKGTRENYRGVRCVTPVGRGKLCDAAGR